MNDTINVPQLASCEMIDDETLVHNTLYGAIGIPLDEISEPYVIYTLRLSRHVTDIGLTSLCDLGIKVKRLIAGSATITRIPDGLMMNAPDLSDYRYVYELSLYDGRDVTMREIPITSIPDNLTLHHAVLENIKTLPENLTCNTLDIKHTQITHIPESCSVRNRLALNDKVTVVPDNIKCTNISAMGGDPLTLPIRHYDWLGIGNPRTLVEGMSVTELSLYNKSDDEPVTLPDSCRVMSSLRLMNPVYLPENSVITTGLHINYGVAAHNMSDEEVAKMLPLSTILPSRVDCPAGSSISDRVYEIYASRPDIYIVSTDATTIEPTIILIDGEHPDRNIVILDGIISVYTSKKQIGIYTVYKCSDHYAVTDGTINYHDVSIRKCIQGIEKKKGKVDTVHYIRDDGTIESVRFDSYSLTDILSGDDASALYQAATGACDMGVSNFIATLHSAGQYKEQYSIQEIIDITSGRFGHDTFKKIFTL